VDYGDPISELWDAIGELNGRMEALEWGWDEPIMYDEEQVDPYAEMIDE